VVLGTEIVGQELDPVDQELDIEDRASKRDRTDESPDARAHAELLDELPRQSLFGLLPRFELASRELPKPAEPVPFPAARHQDAALSFDHRGGDLEEITDRSVFLAHVRRPS